MTMFTTAQRTQAMLRLALDGPSGSGKTYSAILIAKGLAGGDLSKVALIDTERRSGSLYADLGSYAVANMEPPYTVDKYIAAIDAAEAEGFAVIIIDSMTHAWSGEGGVLDHVDRVAATQTRGNSFAAWKSGTPLQARLIDRILASSCHVIATIRSKTEWVLEENERGKKVPRKVGLAPDQRKDVDYEFTLVFDLSREHVAQASKDRTGLFDDRLEVPSEKMGEELIAWLSGAAAAPAPAPIEVPDADAQPLGTERWLAMVAGAGGLGVLEERLVYEFARYDYTDPTLAPLGFAKQVYAAMQQAAAQNAATRQTTQDAQREQAAAAQQQQAPPQAPATPPAQPAPAPQNAPAPQGQPQPAPEPVQAPWAPASGEVISLTQVGNLRAMLYAKGYREESVTGPLGIASLDVLPASQWDRVVASVRELTDPTPPRPGPTQTPDTEPAPALAPQQARPGAGAEWQSRPAAIDTSAPEAEQQAQARAMRRPDGCTMDMRYMDCAALASGQQQCEACDRYDADWAQLDAGTRRDSAPEHPPWGTPRKAGTIDDERLKRLAIKCGQLEKLGVAEEQWRLAMWGKESAVSRRELSKAAADRLDKYLKRWVTDLESGVASPSDKAAA